MLVSNRETNYYHTILTYSKEVKSYLKIQRNEYHITGFETWKEQNLDTTNASVTQAHRLNGFKRKWRAKNLCKVPKHVYEIKVIYPAFYHGFWQFQVVNC